MPDIDVNGTTLHYVEDGPPDAPALVFSPSMFFDVRMFAAQAEQFADRYRVVRYDLRGQGRSARMPREQLDMETQADDAAALIEALDLAPCVYAGCSMGGFIALRLAARRPELLRSAVVMGSSADAEEAVAEMDGLIEALGAHGMEPVLDGVLQFMLGDTTLTDPARAGLLADVREMLMTRGPEYADAAWHIPHRAGVLDELPGITVPVLVLAGAEDHTYPPVKSEQMAALIPGAELVVVEQAGHVLPLEHPEAVNAVLEDHLASLRAVAS
jgi:3-oxoadipate enol-lactonase